MTRLVYVIIMPVNVCLCRSVTQRYRFRPISIAFFLLLFLLFGLTAATSDTTNFRELKMKKDVSVLASNGALTVTKSSHNGFDSDSDDDDSDEDDDDDDDDDDDKKGDDKNERIQNAIVGAVPAVLGLLAIIILCIFMLCGRNRTGRNERPKWSSRNDHFERPSTSYNLRSNQNLTEVDLSMDVDNDDDWSHVYHRTPPLAAVHSPVPSYDSCVQTASVEDLPPSYDEVMQGAGHVRPIAVTT